MIIVATSIKNDFWTQLNTGQPSFQATPTTALCPSSLWEGIYLTLPSDPSCQVLSEGLGRGRGVPSHLILLACPSASWDRNPLWNVKETRLKHYHVTDQIFVQLLIQAAKMLIYSHTMKEVWHSGVKSKCFTFILMSVTHNGNIDPKMSCTVAKPISHLM